MSNLGSARSCPVSLQNITAGRHKVSSCPKSKDETAWTPLSKVVEGGHEAAVKLLVSQVDDVADPQDWRDQMPQLSTASYETKHSTRKVKLLVQAEHFIALCTYGASSTSTQSVYGGSNSLKQVVIEICSEHVFGGNGNNGECYSSTVIGLLAK
jgi:hypothetical protein